MANIINGFEIAKQTRLELATKINELKAKTNKEIGLDVIIVGENPASQIYVRNKEKACQEVGIASNIHRLSDTTTEQALIDLIHQLNANENINGILVQLPLPKGLDENKILNEIHPDKDVDGFHPVNLGKLVSGQKGLIACTPKGCLKLIKTIQNDLTGLNAVVVGRSTIVGKPMGLLLTNENCTVTTAHSRTKDLDAVCNQADILVVATGRPKMIKQTAIKSGAIVIDVGINRLEDGSLCGDVDFENVKDKCQAITPVPKGVGPMTIAMLLENTVDAFCLQNNIV